MRRAVLAVKPVNDTELVVVQWTLPGGFGYILNELHMNIEVDVASNFTAAAVYRSSLPNPALGAFDYLQVLEFANGGRNGTVNNLRSTRVGAGILSRVPILPGSGGATQALSCHNLNVAVGAAGVINAVISFWEYDLEQLAWYPAHSAANVVTR